MIEHTDFAVAAVAMAREGRVSVLYNEHYDITIAIEAEVATVTHRDGSFVVVRAVTPSADEASEGSAARDIWHAAAELRRLIPCIPPGNLAEMGGALGLARSLLMVRRAARYAARGPCEVAWGWGTPAELLTAGLSGTP